MSSNHDSTHQLAEQLYVSWAKAEAAFRLKRLPQISDEDISFAQFEVLMVLNYMDNPQATVKDLAELTLKSSSAITQLVAGLEKLGFVERTHSTEDRRQVFVRATDKGQAKFSDIYGSLISSLAQVIYDIDPDQIKEYIRTNNEIAERI